MSDRSRGFRFFPTDAAVLAVGAAATVWLVPRAGPPAWLVPFVLVHFFLFCNVFRVRRSYELIWAAAFAVNCGTWMALDRFSWPGVIGVQAPITIAVIVMEIRSPRYHGVGSRPR